MSEFVQQGRGNNKKSGNNGQRNKQQHQQSANNPRSTFLLKCRTFPNGLLLSSF